LSDTVDNNFQLIVPKVFEGLSTFRNPKKYFRYKAFHGGRGGGKSHAFAIALVSLAAKQEIRVLCCREIQNSIKDSSKRLIEDKINAAGLGWFFTSTETEIRGLNGSIFTFKGLFRNLESITSTEGIDICWIEEADSTSAKSFEKIIPTIRKEGSEIWLSWNPSDEFAPIEQLFRSGTPPPKTLLREVNYKDNQFFPSVLEMERQHMLVTNPVLHKHVWEGGYIVAENALFDQESLVWQKDFIKEGRVRGDWIIFETYNLRHRYAIGADVSEGVGRDSSTAIVFDFTTMEVVAEFESRTIEPDLFGHELFNLSEQYGGCLVCPEVNSCGNSTVSKLRELGANLYLRKSNVDKIKNLKTGHYGWRTGSNKPTMMYELKDALVEKEIKLISKYLVKEIESYDADNIKVTRFDPKQTRHYDRVMAMAIVWQMRAEVAKTKKPDIAALQQARINSLRAKSLQ